MRFGTALLPVRAAAQHPLVHMLRRKIRAVPGLCSYAVQHFPEMNFNAHSNIRQKHNDLKSIILPFQHFRGRGSCEVAGRPRDSKGGEARRPSAARAPAPGPRGAGTRRTPPPPPAPRRQSPGTPGSRRGRRGRASQSVLWGDARAARACTRTLPRPRAHTHGAPPLPPASPAPSFPACRGSARAQPGGGPGGATFSSAHGARACSHVAGKAAPAAARRPRRGSGRRRVSGGLWAPLSPAQAPSDSLVEDDCCPLLSAPGSRVARDGLTPDAPGHDPVKGLAVTPLLCMLSLWPETCIFVQIQKSCEVGNLSFFVTQGLSGGF